MALYPQCKLCAWEVLSLHDLWEAVNLIGIRKFSFRIIPRWINYKKREELICASGSQFCDIKLCHLIDVFLLKLGT